MSDNVLLTQESLRIGTGNLFACFHCGIPKPKTEFEGESLSCRTCAQRVNSAAHSEVTEETLRKTKFDLATDALKESQDPAIPAGVRDAHKILNGRTSSHLLASVIKQIETGKGDDGQDSFLPRDSKLYIRAIESLQRAEIRHDEFLKEQPPASSISLDDATALSIDTLVNEMIKDKSLRIRILSILYSRCHDLVADVIEASTSPVSDAKPYKDQSDLNSDLVLAGVL